MGARTRSFANLLNTDGTFLSGAINNSSLSSVTAIPSAAQSDSVLISSQTASASASISFTSGIDSTYDEYWFIFNNIHPATDNTTFGFNGSIDSGSNYNVTKTTSFFRATHEENDTAAALQYQTDKDIAQGTGDQQLAQSLSADSDGNVSGIIRLYNPSSTTYVKHFIAEMNETHGGDITINTFVAGYFNTTSAINAVRFQMASGNIDDGTIALYGLR